MYFIRISGYIAEGKVNEFTQTADACFVRRKHFSTDTTFSKDLINSDLCHYQSTWKDEQSYNDFMNSEDYQVLLGCFRVLGSIKKISRGKMTPEQDTNED